MPVLLENSQNKVVVDNSLKKLIKKAVDLSLKSEGFSIPSEISVSLVDDEAIRTVNRDARKIDSATDVLSFPMADIVEGSIRSDSGDYDLDKNLLLLGDIVISLETAKRQALEYGHPFEREVAFLATHGAFHLLGYDHEDPESERKMHDKQEAVLARMGLKRTE